MGLGLALLLAGGAAQVVTGAEPSPSGEPSPSLDRSIPLLLPNVARPLTTDELLDVRAELVPARPPVALVAEASIDLHPRMSGVFCPQHRDLCMIGALVTTDGTMPVVYADRTVRELYQRSRDSIDGILAFELRRYSLRFLGRVVVPPDGTLVQPVSPETMAWADEINAGEVVAVDGWLGVLGWDVECPAPLPELVGDGDPDDSPFVRCPAGWIAPEGTLPEQGPWSGSLTPAGFAIPVQASAYQHYAPDPGDVEDYMVPPRRGVYLLRHVGIDGGPPTGWQVGGRLDPVVVPSPPAADEALTSVAVGDWTATCDGVATADCQGVAALFVNNLARGWKRVFDESGGRLVVEPRPDCPPVPSWADASGCWQASAPMSNGVVCMVIDRQSPPRTSHGFGQVGGDDLTGRAGGPPPGWPTCN